MDETASLSFESWFLRRVAQAVEAGEVSVDLLTELQDEFDAARERPQKERYAAAIRHIADLAGVPETEARSALEAIEAQPTEMRELLLRQFVGAWLTGQARVYRDQQGRA